MGQPLSSDTLFSRAEPAPATVTSVTTAIRSLLGDKVADALLGSGLVRVVQSGDVTAGALPSQSPVASVEANIKRGSAAMN